MDVLDDQGSSQLTGALRLFEERLQEQTFTIQGIPGFVTMTHRGNCATCETYAVHAIAAARCLMVAILSHWIKVTFQTAWPQVMTHIEDKAMDEAQGRLHWHRDRYEEAIKSIKALKEKFSSKRDHCCKAEYKQSKLATELKNLQKEVKSLGKCKASPVSHEWCEWEFKLDFDTAE